MQSENRMFDDFVKVLNGAAGTFAGMGREAEANFRERVREWVGGMDMVSRDEFEAVKAIAVAAREENEALKARIDKLERSEEHTSELQSLMRNSYAVFCLKKKRHKYNN